MERVSSSCIYTGAPDFSQTFSDLSKFRVFTFRGCFSLSFKREKKKKKPQRKLNNARFNETVHHEGPAGFQIPLKEKKRF